MSFQHSHGSMRAEVRSRGILRRRTVLATALLLILAPAVLWAHAALLRSVPARGAHVPSPPVELRLTFSETPELAFTVVTLLEESGTSVPLAPPALAPESRRTLIAPIRGTMRTGVYTVRWQVAGADGHPSRGQFVFTVAGTAPVTGDHHEPVIFPEGARGFGAESPAYVGLRWLQFLATLIVLGALCFGGLMVRTAASTRTSPLAFLSAVRQGASKVGFSAALSLAIIAVLRLGAQSYALHGPIGLRDASLLQGIVMQTRWGWGWVLEVVGVVLVAWGLRGGARHASPPPWRPSLAYVGGGVLALSLAMSGHALAVPVRPLLAVAMDTLHVLASGAWLGSLLMVLAIGVPAARQQAGADWPQSVAALVRGLHPVALVAVGLLTVTGAYAAWMHVGSLSALWQSGYGRTLLVKLALVCAVVAIGGLNARHVRPRLVNVAGVQRFQRVAGAELAVGVIVLLITAVLVATPTAIDMGAMQAP